jgi:hypothetical protein
MYRGVWPSLGRGAEGIEVSIDVHSVLEGSLDKERSACRSLYPLIAFRWLTYLASYDTAPSVLPMEVAHPVVPVEELTRSSSPVSMLPAALSEALGISLSDIMAWYFDGSEESERVHHIEEALDRRSLKRERDSKVDRGCWGSKPMRGCLPVSTMKGVC